MVSRLVNAGVDCAVKPVLIIPLAFALGILLQSLPLGAEEKAPYFQDQYSGRTISDMNMAADLVIARFYNAPRYNTIAPAFTLVDLETEETVFLKHLHEERPVVLLFASWGCDVMRESISELLAVHEEFEEDFDFVMIYIREAHSLDGLYPVLGKLKDPSTMTQRKAAARACCEDLELPFRILVDRIDDRVATRWAAWPIRLFVVDTEGIVVYSGMPGPWGYSPGKGFEASLAKELRKHEDRFSQISLEDFLRSYPRPKN